jgi:hypothetical protein
MQKKILLALVTCTGLGGCTFLPTIGYDREEVIQTAENNSKKIDKITLQKARMLAVGWRDTIESAAVSRNNQALITEEVLYYGTLVFTGAQSAIAARGTGTISNDLLHARNIAGAAALGSTLFSAHYKSAEQRPVFEKAAARMRCVTDVLSDIDESVVNQWPREVFATLKRDDGVLLTSLLRDIPKQVVEFVERKSVPDLRAALESITVGMPTRAELSQAIEEYTKTKQQSTEQASDKTSVAATIAYRQAQTAKLTTQGFTTQEATQEIDKQTPVQTATSEQLEDQTKFIVAVETFTFSIKACGVTYTQ